MWLRVAIMSLNRHFQLKKQKCLIKNTKFRIAEAKFHAIVAQVYKILKECERY